MVIISLNSLLGRVFFYKLCPWGSSITTSQQQCDPLMEKLLTKFASVFDTPRPCKDHEHKILLKERTTPICQRPYRYPQFQKTEIEKIVSNLLEIGSIRPS